MANTYADNPIPYQSSALLSAFVSIARPCLMASHVTDLKVTTGRDNLMTLHERFLVISVPAQIFISADEEENDAEDDVELHRAENGDYCPGEDEDGCFEEGRFAGLVLGFWIKSHLKMPELAAFGLVLRH